MFENFKSYKIWNVNNGNHSRFTYSPVYARFNQIKESLQLKNFRCLTTITNKNQVEGGKMKQYVVSAVVSVSDEFRGRKPDIEMINKFIKEYFRAGVIDRSFFRGKVTMEIKDVQLSIMEMKMPTV